MQFVGVFFVNLFFEADPMFGVHFISDVRQEKVFFSFALTTDFLDLSTKKMC